MSSKREAILAMQDIKSVEVQVPEWGMSVPVRGMNGAERDAYEASLVIGRGADMDVNMANARAKMVAVCVVDETGARLFSDEDIPALSRKSAVALDRIFAVAQSMSGLTKADMEALAKNSASAPSASSHTG